MNIKLLQTKPWIRWFVCSVHVGFFAQNMQWAIYFSSFFLLHMMQTLKGSQGKGDGEILVPSEHGCEVLLTGGSLQRRALNCFKSGLHLGDRGQNACCCPGLPRERMSWLVPVPEPCPAESQAPCLPKDTAEASVPWHPPCIFQEVWFLRLLSEPHLQCGLSQGTHIIHGLGPL